MKQARAQRMTKLEQLKWLMSADMLNPSIDKLVCELVAQAAAAGHPICLGLSRPEDIPKLYPLVYLFDSYGMELGQRLRKEGDGAFVFLSSSRPASEFEGARVRVKHV